MEIKVSTDELRQKRLFVATPMYGGTNLGLYMKACLDLQAMCIQYGIECRFSFIFNESLITRARNYLVDEFLRSGCTHLLFIDADIQYDPKDVLALLALNYDISGGPYPKKSINWNNVMNAVKRNVKNPKFEAGVLDNVTGDFVFNPVPGTTTFKISEPVEVMEIGTGFMMIKREVFDHYKDKYPRLNYKPDHIGQANFDGSRYIHAYFDTVIDHGYTFDDVHRLMEKAAKGENVKKDFHDLLEREKNASHRYLSEDYMFCQNARAIGYKVFLCPWMKTVHVGTYGFQGNLEAVAAFSGNLR